MMVRHARPMLIVLVLAALGTVAAGSARAETLLRWKFQPGQTLHYVMTQQMVQKIHDTPKGPVILTTTVTGDMIWKVESVDKQGVATMSQAKDRMRIRVRGPQGVLIDFDSASGKESEGKARMLAPLFDAMIKKSSMVRIDAQGKALEAKTPQGLLENIDKLAGGKQLAEMFSPEAMKQYSDTVVLAQQPVKKGDTWSRQVEMRLPFAGALTVEYKYEYLGTHKHRGKEVEKLSLTMEKKPGKKEPDEKPAEKTRGEDKKDGKLPTLKFNEWTASGAIFFDNKAGRLLDSDMKTLLTAEIGVMDKQLKMELEATVHMELQPAETAKKTPKP